MENGEWRCCGEGYRRRYIACSSKQDSGSVRCASCGILIDYCVRVVKHPSLVGIIFYCNVRAT
jgi:uncharacterized protein (UPF0212 family)